MVSVSLRESSGDQFVLGDAEMTDAIGDGVAGGAGGGCPGAGGGAVHEAETLGEDRGLNDTEKLVLVCLAQRYLRNEPRPQPLTWAEVADGLNALKPKKKWTEKRAAHIVARLRKRLSEGRRPRTRGRGGPAPIG
jgi:hypothetical protein